ncbi:ribosomal protein L36e [Hyaloraphidium curvatum]|nr:ribosomal protein L36e [Hyaloraphidium curvatum]
MTKSIERTPVQKTGIAAGVNAGHVVTPRVLKPKPVSRKGHVSKRVKHVRELIREVAGFAPYERRVMELLRNSKDKRAKKLAKRKLGTMRRAKTKIDELSGIIAEQRRGGHHE